MAMQAESAERDSVRQSGPPVPVIARPTAGRACADRPAPPPRQTQCRPRPRRRSRDASRCARAKPAIFVMARKNGFGRGARADAGIDESRHVVVPPGDDGAPRPSLRAAAFALVRLSSNTGMAERGVGAVSDSRARRTTGRRRSRMRWAPGADGVSARSEQSAFGEGDGFPVADDEVVDEAYVDER